MTRQRLREIKQEINYWKDTRKMYPYPIIIELYNEIKRLQNENKIYINELRFDYKYLKKTRK